MRILLFLLLLYLSLFILNCSDSNGETNNVAPIITRVCTNLSVLCVNDTFNVQITAFDDKNDNLGFSWYTDRSFVNHSDSNVFSWVFPPYAGMHTITCVVSDQDGNNITKTIPVRIVDSYSEAFDEAVADAEISEPSEIYTTLTPIVITNQNIQWQYSEGSPSLIVTTFTKYNTYDTLVDDTLTITWVETWVCVAPELHDFIENNILITYDTPTRIKQLLGMPASHQGNRIVELAVKPQDLFRPCKDSEITDQTAGLIFPINTDTTYINWFNNQVVTNWYPWTKLGYTYDWGNPLTEFGLNEFCVRKNAKVKVKAVFMLDDYLNNFKKQQPIYRKNYNYSLT